MLMVLSISKEKKIAKHKEQAFYFSLLFQIRKPRSRRDQVLIKSVFEREIVGLDSNESKNTLTKIKLKNVNFANFNFYTLLIYNFTLLRFKNKPLPTVFFASF